MMERDTEKMRRFEESKRRVQRRKKRTERDRMGDGKKIIEGDKIRKTKKRINMKIGE